MHRANCFAEESREEIVKSNVNNSTSKHLWTFYKERRFPEPRPNCPYIAYDHDTSTISQKKTKFGSAARRVFTEASEGPSASAYSPSFNRSISGVNGVTFG